MTLFSNYNAHSSENVAPYHEKKQTESMAKAIGDNRLKALDYLFISPEDARPDDFRKKAVDRIFKGDREVSIGFGWSPKYNQTELNIYKSRKGSAWDCIAAKWKSFTSKNEQSRYRNEAYFTCTGGIYDTFYKPSEAYIKSLIPEINEYSGFDIRFLPPDDPQERSDSFARIRIIDNTSFTRWEGGNPVSALDIPGIEVASLSLTDPLLRPDVVGINTQSRHLKAYLYIDDSGNIEHAACEIWPYLDSARRSKAVKECIVRSLGIISKVRNGSSVFSAGHLLSSELKDALRLISCPEIKSGMSKEEAGKALVHSQCLLEK